MNAYLLSVLNGRQRDFKAQLLVYVLAPWSGVYRLGLWIHQGYWLLRGRVTAPKPVISVGNITVGGSGKTPIVIWLAKNLQAKGLKSVILTRGYMPAVSTRSDEVEMLNEQIPYVPVVAGADRGASIRKAEKTLPSDVYICDDAFQHWAIHRDLDVVAIDAVNPFGNGFLLPAGILREPLSALKRADVFILNKTDAASDVPGLIARLRKFNDRALILQSRYKSSAAIDLDGKMLAEDFLKGQSVAGVCAIGDPASFESSLKNSGAETEEFFTYRDHHAYEAEDVQRIVEACRLRNLRVVVTTHKDMVKLRAFKDALSGVQLVYIPIQLEVFEGDNEFFKKVLSICHR